MQIISFTHSLNAVSSSPADRKTPIPAYYLRSMQITDVDGGNNRRPGDRTRQGTLQLLH